ncbi:MAG: protease modulator HflK [bacterium]
MTKLPERIAAATAALTLAVTVVDILLAGQSGLLVFRALMPYSFWTVALCGVAFARARMARLAQEEKRDAATAGGGRGDSALFAGPGDDVESLWIARSREQFERFVVPTVTPILAVALGFWSWRLFHELPALAAVSKDRMLAAAFLGGQAFLLFLFSRYQIGLARDPEHRVLRGPGIASGVLCFASLFAMLGAIASELAWMPADRWAALALVVVVMLIAAENALRFLIAAYSPRRQQAFGTAYESRIGGLLADPATCARSIAQTLDYQFGFNVSHTWFYRFLEGALVPLVVVQLVALYFMSSLVFLGPEEEGILERFGKPLAGAWHLDSGFHLKRPWPFETVRRLPAKRVQTVNVGYDPGTNAAPRVLLWTVAHYRNEDLFLTASAPDAGSGGDVGNESVPVSLISLNIPIEYRITNIYSHVYGFADPVKTLRGIAYRALTRELDSRDLADLLTGSRLDLARLLRERVQAEADRLGLGVEVLFVSLRGIHPPVPVAEAFQSVVGAMEEREAQILDARAYAASKLPVAAAEAARTRRAAEAYRDRRVQLASAEAAQFEKRLGAYRQAPEVYKSRQYLASLREALSNTRKVIVDAPASEEIIYLNLEERNLPGLFDMGLSPDEEEFVK